MSNPGVLSLASLEAVGADYRFEIEDNIGEAIHIHYKDIRLDAYCEAKRPDLRSETVAFRF